MFSGPLRVKGFLEVNNILYPNAVAPASGYVLTSAGPNSTSFYWSSPVASSIFSGTTDGVAEGSTNKYFTNARAITAVTGTITTTNITEGNNLYFTNPRALMAVTGDQSWLTAGGWALRSFVMQVSGNVLVDAQTYAAGIGTLTSQILNAQIMSASGALNNRILSVSGLIPTSTTNLPEGSNLYFNDARALTAVTGSASWSTLSTKNDLTLVSGQIPSTTTNLPEGSNLYFTNPRAISAVTGSQSWADLTNSNAVNAASIIALSGMIPITSYVSATMSANQTTNLTVGNRVNFDISEGGNIPVLNGIFTLNSGIAYNCSAYIADNIVTDQTIVYRWYNISNPGYFENIIVPASSTQIELRIVASGLSIIYNSGTSAYIQAISVGNTAGGVAHNLLTGLQGGKSNTYYHSDQPINSGDSVLFAGLKVGQIIFPTSLGNSGLVLQSNGTQLVFASGGVSSHSTLTNLQGGGGDNYYHSDQPVNTTDSVTFAGITIGNIIHPTVLASSGKVLQSNGTSLVFADVMATGIPHNSLNGLQGGNVTNYYHSDQPIGTGDYPSFIIGRPSSEPNRMVRMGDLYIGQAPTGDPAFAGSAKSNGLISFRASDYTYQTIGFPLIYGHIVLAATAGQNGGIMMSNGMPTGMLAFGKDTNGVVNAFVGNYGTYIGSISNAVSFVGDVSITGVRGYQLTVDYDGSRQYAPYGGAVRIRSINPSGDLLTVIRNNVNVARITQTGTLLIGTNSSFYNDAGIIEVGAATTSRQGGRLGNLWAGTTPGTDTITSTMYACMGHYSNSVNDLALYNNSSGDTFINGGTTKGVNITVGGVPITAPNASGLGSGISLAKFTFNGLILGSGAYDRTSTYALDIRPHHGTGIGIFTNNGGPNALEIRDKSSNNLYAYISATGQPTFGNVAYPTQLGQSGHIIVSNGQGLIWTNKNYADNIVVDPNGGGDYTQISDAVNRAITNASINRRTNITVHGVNHVGSTIQLTGVNTRYISIRGISQTASIINLASTYNGTLFNCSYGLDISNLTLSKNNKYSWFDYADGAASGLAINIDNQGEVTEYTLNNVDIIGFGKGIHFTANNFQANLKLKNSNVYGSYTAVEGMQDPAVGSAMDFENTRVFGHLLEILGGGTATCVIARSGIEVNIDYGRFYGTNPLTLYDASICKSNYLELITPIYVKDTSSFKGTLLQTQDVQALRASGAVSVNATILQCANTSANLFEQETTTAALTLNVVDGYIRYTALNNANIHIFGLDKITNQYKIGRNSYPMSPGTSGQVLATDGIGGVYWKT